MNSAASYSLFQVLYMFIAARSLQIQPTLTTPPASHLSCAGRRSMKQPKCIFLGLFRQPKPRPVTSRCCRVGCRLGVLYWTGEVQLEFWCGNGKKQVEGTWCGELRNIIVHNISDISASDHESVHGWKTFRTPAQHLNASKKTSFKGFERACNAWNCSERS